MKTVTGFIFVLLTSILSGCGYNTLQTQDEQVNASQARILNVYKQRADLVPNLVNTVQGYASHEKGVFTEIATARSRVGQVTLPENASQEQMDAFVKAQKEMGSALSRLLVVAENYPQLKADANFRQFQDTLERLETQAGAARGSYIRAVQAYNGTVRQFPTNLTAMMFGNKAKPQLQFEDEATIKTVPRVDFGSAKGPEKK